MTEGEPDVAKNGEDEDLRTLIFDPKQPADEIMTSFQIATAYLQMARMAEEECDRPDMSMAFRMALYHTLEDLYRKIMNAQSVVVKRRMAEHMQDEVRGLDEKYQRVKVMWQIMEDSARADVCFLCHKLVLPEHMHLHLADKHPKRDPFGIDESGYVERDPPLTSEEWDALFNKCVTSDEA